MNNEKQTLSPLMTFAEAMRRTTEEEREAGPTEAHVDMLKEVALDPELQEGEKLPKLLRKQRAFARAAIERALEAIRAESGDDAALEAELVGTLQLSTMGLIGLNASAVQGPKDVQARVRINSETESYTPTVPVEYLTKIEAIEQGEGRVSSDEKVAIAKGFLEIYKPAQDKLDKKSTRGAQERLDTIATTNAFSHAVAGRLSKLAEIQETSAVDDIKGEIVRQLELQANDMQLRQLDRHKQEHTIGMIDEIKMFDTRVLKGARTELISYRTLASAKEQLGVSAVEMSSVTQDLTEGWDLRLDGYHVDIKSRGGYSKLLNEGGDAVTYVNEAVLIKHVPDFGAVIVIDAEKAGDVGIHKNRFTAGNPQGILDSVKKGIEAIDNLDKA